MKRAFFITLMVVQTGLSAQWTENGNIMTTNDKVGIGTISPVHLLHLRSTWPHMRFEMNNDKYSFIEWNELSTRYAAIGWSGHTTPKRMSFHTYDGVSFVERMSIADNGNVGIGTLAPDAKLAVNGNIHTKEVKVDLVGWPDYVFDKDYELPSLKEVEAHIVENGHLQDIPSAQDVAENGIHLGEMNAKLLQKIEELMLYTIAQENKIKLLESRLQKLESKQ